MKEINIKNFIAITLCIVLSFNTYADLKIDNYFNSLEPQRHIYKMYTNERKEELSGNIVNYDDIDDLIHIYNPEILNNWNSWENNKSANDIYDDYQSAADSLFGSASSQDSEMQEAMMSAQGRAMQIQADKNADDSYTNFLSNYLKEKQLVLSTKVLDLNYQKSIYQMLNAKIAVEEAKINEESAENALEYGSGTQIGLLTAKKAVIDANSSLVIAESNIKTYKSNLLLNCGKEVSEDIYVSPINLYIGDFINTINIQNDYQKAVDNSIQYEIYRRRIDNARTTEVKNEYQILYDAAKDKISNDIENKYLGIIDAFDSCNNREVALKLAKDNFKKANNEYSHGNISLKELNTAEHNVSIAANNVQIANFDLKIAIEKYIYVVEGFGDC